MVRKRSGPTRLNKVLYCGEIGVGSLERIGMEVTVEDEVIGEKLRERAEEGWVTDRYGLMAEFKLTGSAGLLLRSEDEVLTTVIDI